LLGRKSRAVAFLGDDAGARGQPLDHVLVLQQLFQFLAALAGRAVALEGHQTGNAQTQHVAHRFPDFAGYCAHIQGACDGLADAM
jgi:hypothetical protein